MFRAQLRYYTIKFINASYSPATVLQSKSTAYGETPVYAGQTPVYNPSASDVEDWGEFIEWTPQIVPVAGDATYTAKFKSRASKTRKLLTRQLKTVESSTVTVIGDYALAYSKNLVTASFPAATTVNTDAFNSCSELTRLELPEVTKIGNSAFYYCSNLTRMELPKVTKIENYAFYGCSKLTTLVIGVDSDAVCTLDSTGAIPSSVTKIYVPYALVDAYKAATNWSSYASKIAAYEEPTECVSLTITADNVAGYETTATVHYTAVCKYNKEGTSQGDSTMTFTGTGKSEAFEKNPSTESSRQVVVSYTFLGKTATATITQGKYVGDPLGGTIFYIDDTADGEYEFYNAEGTVISSVAVGDAPAMYKVLTPGTRDKYYICNTTLYPRLQWGMFGTSTGATGTAIGTGKSNTDTVMATSAATKSGTIWYKLAQNRSNSLEGCTDWFVPSKDEMNAVRTAGIISFSNELIWSSSEGSSDGACSWDYSGWNNNSYKRNSHSVFFARAF